ncbi:hypothetical protein [Sanguibacter suaedae]|uniref:Uncharacterized protein n=1 Tax=Sanguibacter suaedae TaxID=2795737 RepID=A0A934MAF3_9MICO|nr:hypothetical protein [Sanguibacter suaedae]MBI9114176.1 hypothetical protein [Sanguibacter suaedae]
MNRRPALRTASVLGALSLVLMSGCSSDDTSSGGELKADEGPLSKILEPLWGSYEDVDWAAQEAEIENLVAQCMTDKGFEYIPAPASSTTVVTEDDMDEYGTEEWVAENGYGFSMNEEPEDLEGEEVEEEYVDPNAPYVESLSESAAAEYYEALNGPDIWSDMTEEEMEEYVYDWKEGGCYGAAQHEVNGETDAYSDEEHAEVTEAMDALYTEMSNDPRMTALNDEWAECMADAGYPEYATPDEAMEAAMNAHNALWEEASTGAVDEETGEFPEDFTGPSDEALAEAREMEIAIAVADFGCKEEVDWEQESLKVQFELEKQFVQDYKPQLDALVADAEAGSSE